MTKFFSKNTLIKTFIVLFFTALVFLFTGLSGYTQNSLEEIKTRGILLVGTTGDYMPMSYISPETKEYIGYDIELAKDLAKSMGVDIKFIKTSWPTLMEDTIKNKFDIAMSGITITKERKDKAIMSKGYINNGKTILCRKEDENKYTNLESINNPNVRVMENPGGLNEKFARENLPKSQIIIHNVNEEIPNMIASGKADVMITEILEAKYYVNKNPKLAAPTIDKPFTKGQIGILVPKENKHLIKYINKFIINEKRNGRLEEIAKNNI